MSIVCTWSLESVLGVTSLYPESTVFTGKLESGLGSQESVLGIQSL